VFLVDFSRSTHMKPSYYNFHLTNVSSNSVWNNSIAFHNKQKSYIICFDNKIIKERLYTLIYNNATQSEQVSTKLSG
jgi:hypothetical protein